MVGIAVCVIVCFGALLDTMILQDILYDSLITYLDILQDILYDSLITYLDILQDILYDSLITYLDILCPSCARIPLKAIT
jgi:hypothetical protein